MGEALARPSRDDSLSVVVPYFRQAHRVVRAVASLLAQTHPPERVIVISDGDPEVPHLDLVGLDPNRVIVHRLLQNRGHFFAREVAWRAADSRWIGFVDADDFVEPRWAEALIDAGKRNDGVAFCASRHISSYGRLDRTRRISSASPERAALPEPRPKRFASHTTIYRRDRIAAAGGFDPGFRVGFDTLFINLVALSGRFGVVDEALYVRRRKDVFRRKSLTRNRMTGKGSPVRLDANTRVGDLYQRFAPVFRADPADGLRRLLAERDPELEGLVAEESRRLRDVLGGPVG